MSITDGLTIAAQQLRGQGIAVPESVLEQAWEFIVRRHERQVLDAGHERQFVAAVLSIADRPAIAE